MTITRNLAVVCSLLVAAGCSHREKRAEYGEPTYAPAYGAAAPSQSTTTAASPSSVNPEGISASSAAPGQATDKSVASQVKQSLSADPALASIAPNIDVKANNGTITLSGTVPSEQEKQRIETLAQSTSGVSRVENQLEVSLTPTSESAGQTSRIYSNSTAQASVPSTPNQPNNEILSPTSDRPNTTNRVFGGDSFKVNVVGGNQADQTLAQQITSSLQTDPAITSLGSGVKIALENGKATLTGTVMNEDAKNRIESAIQQIKGVTSVDNQLQVSPTDATPNQGK